MELRLRPWRGEDAADITPYAADWAVAQWLRDVFPHPYTQKDAENFIAACLAADPASAIFLAIEADGRAVGSAALTRGTDVCRGGAELGYWLAAPLHGRGIMTAAVRRLCLLGFQRWDIGRIYAEPFAPNAASRRVLEKAGFCLEGRLRRNVIKAGEVMDSCVYGLLREEFSREAIPAGQELAWTGETHV